MWNRKARKEARKAAKAAELEQEVAEAEAQHRATLVEHLEEAKNFAGADISEVPDCPLHVHTGERVYLNGQGAHLIEPRRAPGHYEGGSQGFSVRVPGTKSMRYRVGATRGTFVQGDEQPTSIDEGAFVITDQRAVFIGNTQTREWLWSKLIGVTHCADAPWTAIAVSNRQKTSGVLYDTAGEDDVRFMLDLAIAHASGTTDSLVHDIQTALSALGPAPAPAPPAATVDPPP